MPIKSYRFDAELKSKHANECVTAHFDLRWRRIRGSKEVHDPEAAIRDYVRDRANSLSAEESIARYLATEDRINTIFGTPCDICSYAIRLLWVNVRLDEVNENLLSRARERERLQNEAYLREQQRLDEIRHVEAFRSRVLTDPGMALAYWFMQHPDAVSKSSYEAIEDLARRIAAYHPDNKWVEISKIMQSFIDRLSLSERRQLIENLRVWITRHGMHDLVDRLPKDTDEI